MTKPLLTIERVKKYFPVQDGLFSKTVAHVQAVDDVSFQILPGETLGLVGESGCGKSTLARCILRLYPLTAGRILLDGRDISSMRGKELRAIRKTMQIIFQDPFSSLNPRMNVEQLIGEAFIIHHIARGAERRERISELLETVGLSGEHLHRYPHEFSGGQRQRISVARALAVEPRLIIADEPVSSLDVSIRAQIINLLLSLQKRFGLAYLFISHDLGVVRHISDRVAVMYLGRIVEIARTSLLFEDPRHPYTKSLMSVIPVPDPRARKERIFLSGDVPTPIDIPPGCRFYQRCPIRIDRCQSENPPLESITDDHEVACFRAIENPAFSMRPEHATHSTQGRIEQ